MNAPRASTTDLQHLSALVYRRGFLLTLSPHERPRPHWSTFKLPSAYLSYDPDVPFAFVQTAGTWLCLLGPAHDVIQQQSDLRTIATALLDARQRSRAAMHEALDAVAGRYLVIDGDADGVHVQTDATAARSAFRQAGAGGSVASHLQLLGDRVSASRTSGESWEALLATGPQRPPGLVTRLEGILPLTPNTELHLQSGRLSRTWPRRPVEMQTPADVAARIAPLLAWHASTLRSDQGSVVELTVGVVSRALLAVSRALRGTTYITTKLDYDPHRSNGTSELSLRVAGHLTQRLRLAHRIITVPGPLEEGRLREILLRNTPQQLTLATLAAQIEQCPPDQTYLRPDALSLGQLHYRKIVRKKRDFNVASMVEAAIPPQGRRPAVEEAFDSFSAMTHFPQAIDHGLDPFALLAWEYRVGRFSSAQMLAQDAAFLPVAVGNARCVIEPLLSVEPSDQRAARALKLVIEQCWPAALEYPLNHAMQSGQDPSELRRKAIRDQAERTPLPPPSPGTNLPTYHHTSVEDFSLPFAPGTSRHRIALHPNDPRGEALLPLFGPLELDVLLDERPRDALLVMLHSTIKREKYPYPHFEHRQALAQYAASSVLWIADPTLRLSPTIDTGWYMGTAAIDVHRAAATIAAKTAEAVGATRVIFVGSHAGGFAALAISRHLPASTALAFSSHVDLHDVDATSRNRLFTTAFPGLPSEVIYQHFTDRLNLAATYAVPTPNRIRHIHHPEETAQERAHRRKLASASMVPEGRTTSPDGLRSFVLQDYGRNKKGPYFQDVVGQIAAALTISATS